MVFSRVVSMLKSCIGDQGNFPAKEFYNETWLLRVFLDWFAQNDVSDPPLGFSEGARWYAEVRLPTSFLRRGSVIGETYTHADAVIGHFDLNELHNDLSLAPSASQFVIVEGKLFERLTQGTSNPRYFDQSTRTVGCIAEALRLQHISPADMPNLGYYMLAPKEQVEQGVFDALIRRDLLSAGVKRRVDTYLGLKDQWYEYYFLPMLEKIDLACVSWEDLLQVIEARDPASAAEIGEFYAQCREVNS